MKKLILLFILVVFFGFTSRENYNIEDVYITGEELNDPAYACNSSEYAEACIPKLQTGFNFVKSYQIDGQNGSKTKVEYSYVFAKGTQYMINICSGGDETDGIVVSLYDSNRKRVTTSNVNGKIYSAIAYPCNATGIYYITFTFEGSSSFCGGAVLGFKR